jgi:FtsZ-binding cell division protein ZapB
MKIFSAFFLISTVNSIEIGCHFSYDHDWHEIGQVYTCEVISMDFSDNPTHITGYSGDHVLGNSAVDVKAFYFGTSCPQFNLTIVPKGFLNFFPNFNMLEFNTCSINSLNGDELEDYPNLERFVIVHSNVQRIPGNLFEFNKNLKYIWFGFQITRVGDGLLEDLGKLEQAYFWDNLCINQTALSAAEVPKLIEGLRENCPDVDPTTEGSSTTEGVTTTSNYINLTTTEGMTTQPYCEFYDLELFVCGLSEEIYSWNVNNEELKEQINYLSDENQNLKEIVEELRIKNENLERRVENLESLMRKNLSF